MSSIWGDIAAARKEIRMPTFDSVGAAGKNGSRKYPYASLKSVLESIIPPLLERGVMCTQYSMFKDGMWLLVTKACKGDDSVILDERPLSNEGTEQQRGSEETYLKRYALCSIFCIAGSDDDDGAEASGRDAMKHDAPAKKAGAAIDPLESAKRRLVAAENEFAELHGKEFKDIHAGTLKRPEWNGNNADLINAIAMEFEEANKEERSRR